MKPVIEINGLGKKYRIRKAEPYLALRDAITDSFRNIFRKRSESKKDFWALQDISLKIKQGERIGIIGKNGAGKSTLLKILSRITWPTTGEAIIRGRLASLLEVGTGFHPELTGRENIYLNGSILGLKKLEIDRQFDAIVDFSGVETFLDTPLKNYSSGMQLRLAFAVAAHLEPEVLLIDEVLAVGDMEFQKKCLGKMEEVSKQHGRTILFVSHNMNYISSLCTKGILLDSGLIIFHGSINEVINRYSITINSGIKGIIKAAHPEIIFRGLTNWLDLQDLNVTSALQVNLGFSIKNFESKNVFFDIAIYNEKGDMVVHSKTRYTTKPFPISPNSDFILQYSADVPNLSPGSYYLTLFVYEEILEQKILFWMDDYPLCNVNSKNPNLETSGTDYLQDVKSVTYPASSFRVI